MKRWLLAFALVGCVTTAARAAVYDGGTLIVRGSLPVGQPGHFDVASNVAEYSNITTFQSLVTLQGPSALVGSGLVTKMIADDITPLGAHPGASVTSFTFSVANFNAHSVRFRPLVRFWNANGAGGGPGTYYGVVGYDFAAVTVPAFTVLLYTALPAPGQFPMPGSTFWAGLAFDNSNGATGATQADLDNVGQGGFHPPTVGSSVDKIFQSDFVGQFFLVDNPSGVLLGYASIGFKANMGWEFVVDNVVPVKPTSWGSLKALYR